MAVVAVAVVDVENAFLDSVAVELDWTVCCRVNEKDDLVNKRYLEKKNLPDNDANWHH